MKRTSAAVPWGITLYLLVIMFSLNAAAPVTFEPEQDRLKSYSDLLPGEKIDFHTGEVNHSMETVSIEGNGLPIKLGHSIHGLGISLDSPRIEFTHRGSPSYDINQHDNNGDHINGGYRTNIQCSRLRLASDAILKDYSVDSQRPLPTNGSFVLSSSVKLKIGLKSVHFFPKGHESSSRFPESASLISPSNWYIECVASSHVVGNNAFKAVSPDGTEYMFDIYQESLASAYQRNKSTTASIYVSSIKDKYGNRLDYSYNRFYYNRHGSDILLMTRLKSISAPDGRELNITYSDGVAPYRIDLDWIKVKSKGSNPVELFGSSPLC